MSYCGASENAFYQDDDVGECWRILTFSSPLILFSLWWGLGSFLLTRSRHPVVLPITQIGGLDFVRNALCFILAFEHTVHISLWKKRQTHDYVDAVLGLQILFLCLLLVDSARRACRDSLVIKTIALLYWFEKFALLRSTIVADKDEDDYKLNKYWAIVVSALATVLLLLITFIARDHRKLLKKSIAIHSEPFLQQEEVILLDKECPEEHVGFFSRLTFSWLSELMETGYKRPLKSDDLFNIRKEDSSHELSKALQQAMRKEKKLIWALYKSGILRPFLVAAPLKLVYDVLLYITPSILLRSFINFLAEEKKENEEWYDSKGTHLALAMFFVAAIQTFSLQTYFQLVYRAGMRVRAALVTTIFNKSLRLSMSSRNSETSGKISNLISTDAQRMQDLFPYLHVVWSSPLQIVLCLYFLWQELRWSALVAVAVILVFLFVITNSITRMTQATNKVLMGSKDERVRVTVEALSSMKLLKMYGWDSAFKGRIDTARESELKILRKYVYLTCASRVLWTATPIFVLLATLGSFVAAGGELDAATAFVSVTLLQLLRFPMAMLPTMFNGAIEGLNSLNRIEAFLSLSELKYLSLEPVPETISRKNSEDSEQEQFRHQLMSPYPTFGAVPKVGPGGPALEIVAGNFYWDDLGEKQALFGVNLRLVDGELCLVMGEVGSGKTALLLALMGELVPDSFNHPYVSLNGSVSYAAQVPWIRNTTVRDNILFGEPYDEKFYNQVLESVALDVDIETFANGDLTEIGEKGINLSGGQKARISLARAVYSRSDILLLESCFEAVDEHVGSTIWQKCFFGVLKKAPSLTGRKRTVIVVTHSVKSDTNDVDRVIVMKDGRISVSGTPRELWNDERYSAFRSQQERSEENKVTKDEAPVEAIKIDKKASGKLISEETATTRGVNYDVYRLYLQGLGGRRIIFYLSFLSLLRIASDISTSRWLAHWSNDVENDQEESLEYYLGIYATFCFLAIIFATVVSISVYLFSLSASRTIHEQLVVSVLRAPMSFFDSTPLGRITQRFTKDMNTLDGILPSLLFTLLGVGFDVLGTIIVVGSVSPEFLIPLPFLALGYTLTQRYYVRTSRELKNLDAISLSPVFSLFAESLDGAVSIRAYKRVDCFISDNEYKLDKNLSAYFMSNSANRWLAIRIEFVGNALVLLAAGLTAAKHGHVNAALAGMAISYTLTITQSLNWVVRTLSDFETNVVSVERIDQYANHIDAEAPLEMPSKPPSNWPTRGEIVIKNLFVRYRPDFDDVLKDLNVKIPAGSHVGCCGKTGCGKSTLFLAFLRIIEPYSGAIEIDGFDTKNIGLSQLREAISIIPQDPVLFRATLRYNLDPLGKKSDAELWHALEISELSDFIKRQFVSTESPLDAIVAEAGADFSFGQRQLLCIARALLRETKILLSDEASSGIDRLTDSKIQAMIKKEFASSTTITIAHRLESILNSDFILVLDAGRVAEFDSPGVLLKNKESKFYSLVAESRRGNDE